MSIFNLLHLEPVLHTLASVWTLAGELVTAGALLWCLNALARFIRLVYDAGRWTGMFWRQYFVPTVLFLADWISWGVAQVDWVEVRSAVKDCLVHMTVLTVLLGQYTRTGFRTAVTVLTALTVERVVPAATVAMSATVRTVQTARTELLTLLQKLYPVQTVSFGGRTSPVRRVRRHGKLIPLN